MKDAASLERLLRERIGTEMALRANRSDEEIEHHISSGDDVEARGDLLYLTAPAHLPARAERLLSRIDARVAASSLEEKTRLLRFLTYFSVDLATLVPWWVVPKTLHRLELAEVHRTAMERLESVAAREPAAERALLGRLQADALARLRAEGIGDEAQAARLASELTGGGLVEFARSSIREALASNLTTAAKARLDGRLETEIGNDYAAFLPHAMWHGTSFVTTNPVLIKLAWDVDPEYWNAQVDATIASHFSQRELTALLSGPAHALTDAVEALDQWVTVSVVERNCRLLRPLFLATEGAHGYVSLQVNPDAHGDAERMVHDATIIYEELERGLGGVPNVVIKVPSTAAGLQAAQRLTARGIGVTVTLTFSLFQALRFAEVLNAGHALVSYIAIMNGRLAFPVRDELAREGVPGGAEAARWAGVEIARKANRMIYSPAEGGGLGVDSRRVKIMIASLRIYDDWIPDLSELWGVPLVTVFPNVRRAYDGRERPLRVDAIGGRTPDEDLRVMMKSEIFRQAWWTDRDGPIGKPNRPLSLDPLDDAAVANWAPVRETLTQFISTFSQMSEMVRDRMTAVCGPPSSVPSRSDAAAG